MTIFNSRHHVSLDRDSVERLIRLGLEAEGYDVTGVNIRLDIETSDAQAFHPMFGPMPFGTRSYPTATLNRVPADKVDVSAEAERIRAAWVEALPKLRHGDPLDAPPSTLSPAAFQRVKHDILLALHDGPEMRHEHARVQVYGLTSVPNARVFWDKPPTPPKKTTKKQRRKKGGK